PAASAVGEHGRGFDLDEEQQDTEQQDSTTHVSFLSERFLDQPLAKDTRLQGPIFWPLSQSRICMRGKRLFGRVRTAALGLVTRAGEKNWQGAILGSADHRCGVAVRAQRDEQ